MYPNCFGWPVIDHLAEHHFGASAKKNSDMHESEGTKTKNDEESDRASQGNDDSQDAKNVMYE